MTLVNIFFFLLFIKTNVCHDTFMINNCMKVQLIVSFCAN